MREPGRAPLTQSVRATQRGRVTSIDNRLLARIAKLAGAPRAPTAGIELQASLGDLIQLDQELFTIHAETKGELEYALSNLRANPEVVVVEEP
jgi:thymidine phosphorylase